MARRLLPLLAALAGLGIAHELEISTRFAPPAVVLRAAYGGTEAVPFAKVQIFAPGESANEYQTGVTDRAGGFALVPNAPGDWRVVIDDELGHRREIKVFVPNPFDGAPQNNEPASRWQRALTGIALLAGATGVLYGYKARRSPDPLR